MSYRKEFDTAREKADELTARDGFEYLVVLDTTIPPDNKYYPYSICTPGELCGYFHSLPDDAIVYSTAE